MRDHLEYNKMIDYIKHSGSCDSGNGFVLYDDDNSSNELFKFYEHSIDFNDDRAIYINDDETYIGHGAGDNISTGVNNTLVGHDAGQANSFGSSVLVGYEAGKNNTRSYTVAVGYQALTNNTGMHNTAIGYSALAANISGTRNTAIGYSAMPVNTDGNYNTCVGWKSGLVLNGGEFNVLLGDASGYSMTIGNNNIGVGQGTLFDTVDGSYNVAVGCNALHENSDGVNNVSIGEGAGRLAVHADNSIYIGYKAGENNLTSNKLYINPNNSAYPLIYGEFDTDIVAFGDNSSTWNIKFVQSRMHMLETTTPTAIANYGAIYTKNDDKLYFQDGAGVEHEVAFA